MEAISKALNNIPVTDVENLLVGLILDGSLDGQIDQVTGVYKRGSNNDTFSDNTILTTLKFEAMKNITSALEDIAISTTNARMTDGNTAMRGMVH